MIYVYAITEHPCAMPADGIRGLDDRPLATRSVGSITAVHSECDSRPATPTAENLWRHEAVVEALMRNCDAVLPARFAMVVADERMLDEALAQHIEPLAAGLARVRGCVELGLRVLWQRPTESQSPAQPADSGRSYMAARLDDERRRRATRERAEQIATTLHDALAPLARDATRRVLPIDDVVMSSAYLVAREGAEQFATRARELSSHHPNLRLLCTGPWPPYHFAPALTFAEVRNA